MASQWLLSGFSVAFCIRKWRGRPNSAHKITCWRLAPATHYQGKTFCLVKYIVTSLNILIGTLYVRFHAIIISMLIGRLCITWAEVSALTMCTRLKLGLYKFTFYYSDHNHTWYGIGEYYSGTDSETTPNVYWLLNFNHVLSSLGE